MLASEQNPIPSRINILKCNFNRKVQKEKDEKELRIRISTTNHSRASVVTTTPHPLPTATSTFSSRLSTVFSSALVPLGNELTSLRVQSTPSTARTRLSLSMRHVATLDILVSSTALSCVSPTPAGNAGTTLRLLLWLLLWLLLLLLLLLSRLRTERVMRWHGTASPSASSSDRQTGLESSQGSLTSSLASSSGWWGLIWQ